jgi:hypothetical protein
MPYYFTQPIQTGTVKNSDSREEFVKKPLQKKARYQYSFI